MADKKLIAKNVHEAKEHPDNESYVYVYTKKHKLVVCQYINGKVWYDYYGFIGESDILFWFENIVCC